jgi:hypothetical protein
MIVAKVIHMRHKADKCVGKDLTFVILKKRE